uniref:Uncharacterized protein n=1 Tax=Heterorhabditis bacteriophora TaxID=37862 RepID=A0A1I7XA27_HETBA
MRESYETINASLVCIIMRVINLNYLLPLEEVLVLFLNKFHM